MEKKRIIKLVMLIFFILSLFIYFRNKNVILAETSGNDSTQKITITFMNNNNLWDKQNIYQNTTPGVPNNPIPEKNQGSFLGWYTEPENGTQYSFTENLSYSQTLYAQFSSVYLVQFKNTQGIIIDSKEVIPGGIVPQTNVEITPPLGEYFSYWYEEGDSSQTPFNFKDQKVNKNLVLVPKFSKTRIVIFISEGSQVDPQYVINGEKAVKPNNPERLGYTFSHWSLEPNSDSEYDFLYGVNKNLTLYANWTPNQVDYTVVYWIEKKDILGDPGRVKSNYAYSTSLKLKAPAGSKKDITKLEADQNKPTNLKSENPLNYSVFNYSDTSIIRGDGQSIINVYYKRIIYSYEFDLNHSLSSLEVNGKTYNENDSKYVMEAKFEQSLKNLWPKNTTSNEEDFEKWESNLLSTRFASNPSYLYPSLINGNERKYIFRAMWQKKGSLNQVNVKVYFDKITGSDYEEQQNYNKVGNTSFTDLNPSIISGVTYFSRTSESIGSNKYLQRDYYKRNSYNLSFNTSGGTMEETDRVLKFEQNVEEPKNPEKNGYEFLGWYYDSTLVDKVDFTNLQMPSSNLMLFAKWSSLENTVKYLDGMNGEELLEQTYGNNEYVTYPSDYIKGETYVNGKGIFNGWFWQVGGDTFEFSESIPIQRDIVLFARWITDGFKITYNLGEGSGNTPVDEETYNLNKKAIVKSNELVQPPSGKVFIGWNENNSAKVYYPNTYINVNGNMSLTAAFANSNDLVNVTYHAGDYENRPDPITRLVNKNTSFVTEGDIFTRKGKKIVGWSTKVNGEKEYDLEQIGVPVTNNDLNLYAVWENVKHTITFIAGDHGTLEDGSQVTFEVEDGTTWNESSIVVPSTVADEGYKLSEWTPNIPLGTEPITDDLVFLAKFKVAMSTVSIKFLNEKGEPLHDELTLTREKGTSIDLTKESDTQEIIKNILKENYLIDKRPENETAIPVLDQSSSVEYVFKGTLFIQSFPSYIGFGRKSLGIPFIKVEKAIYDVPLVIWDNRANKGRWLLTAKLTQVLTSEEDTKQILPRALSYKMNDQETIPLLEQEPQIIATRQNTNSNKYNISEEWKKDQAGFRLEVASNEVKKAGKYKAKILWQVEQTP